MAHNRRSYSRPKVCISVVCIGCCSSLRAFLPVVSRYRPCGSFSAQVPLRPASCATAAYRPLSIFALRAMQSTEVGEIPRGESESSLEGEEPGSLSESFMWHWRNGWEVHYERARNDGAPPLLLLPGFGVGTFHFSRNMNQLSKVYDVYSLDLLGQGKSWPSRAPSRQDGLCYSVDTWTDQVLSFLREVVARPAYIAGNSLGGYIGANLAANHPDRVLGLALLNATPFWAFREPKRYESGDSVPTSPTSGSGRTTPREEESKDEDGSGGGLLRWDGTLPAPKTLFQFGAWYFDRMRDSRTVKTMLEGVYSNPGAIDDNLVREIIAATERGPSNHDYGVGGHEAFTSIVFAPKVAISFETMIDRVKAPLILIYGKEDPWIVPLWGHRIKRQRPDTLYYEISPAGHCPHHETPSTVNQLLMDWLEHTQSGIPPPLSGEQDALEIKEETGVTAKATLIADARPRGPLQWVDSLAWRVSNGGGVS